MQPGGSWNIWIVIISINLNFHKFCQFRQFYQSYKFDEFCKFCYFYKSYKSGKFDKFHKLYKLYQFYIFYKLYHIYKSKFYRFHNFNNSKFLLLQPSTRTSWSKLPLLHSPYTSLLNFIQARHYGKTKQFLIPPNWKQPSHASLFPRHEWNTVITGNTQRVALSE